MDQLVTTDRPESLNSTTDNTQTEVTTAATDYDYEGAILFVFGLLMMYMMSIFLLIVSLIRGSRSETDVMDYLRDLEEMRKAARKKRSSGRSTLGSFFNRTEDERGSNPLRSSSTKSVKSAMKTSSLRSFASTSMAAPPPTSQFGEYSQIVDDTVDDDIMCSSYTELPALTRVVESTTAEKTLTFV